MSSWTPRTILGPSAGERMVSATLLVGVLVYAALALLARRWVTGLAAPIVAVLLAGRHPRARFSAYVLFSAVALRGLVTGAWALVAFGSAGVLILQTPAAQRAWPRLAPGTRRSRGNTRSST